MNVKEKMLEFDLFRPSKDQKEKKRRWFFLNRSLKFYFLTPFIRLGKKVIGRWMVRRRIDIPNKIWNENFYVFHDSIQLALGRYFDDFMLPMNLDKKDGDPGKGNAQWAKSKRESYVRGESRGPEAIVFLRDLCLTVGLEDTAYREFLNIWMFTIQELMNKRWNPQIRHRVPLYISRFNSFMPYYAAWVMRKEDLSHIKVERVEEKDWDKVLRGEVKL